MTISSLIQYVKTIVVLGGSYGDVYVMPPFAVLPGHQHKAFIPYTNFFRLDTTNAPHIFLHAQVTSIRSMQITLSKSFPEYGTGTTLPFDYAVCALESHMPTPLHLWGTHPEVDVGNVNEENNYGGTRKEAVEWLKKRHAVIELSDTVLVVGGGALRIRTLSSTSRQIEIATDIKAVYPAKRVKLLHSRDRLLPRFDVQMHIEGTDDIQLLCTGQTPNTELLKDMDPSIVGENQLAKVLRTLQLGVINDGERNESTQYPHIFAIGDAADAFGAIAAGHNAYDQAEVAARNIIRLIKSAESGANTKSQEESIEIYTPGPSVIGVSLGLCEAVIQRRGQITHKTDGEADLNALRKWPYFGMHIQKEEDVYL
ncbi:hypothetical protein BDQ17DRAFT_1391895 [Cyathus striatus]|nr:hypothetical protein BDQ17DRAFT_1391895 [Cyathus striatus]